jgi:hypothetical protein
MQYSEMAAKLSVEQRNLIEDYLARSWPDTAGLWKSVLGAHGADAGSRAIDIIASTHGVDERMVKALFAAAQLIDPQRAHWGRLFDEGDPWKAFRAVGISVKRPRSAVPAAPTREEVRAAYDAAIRDIESFRGTQQFEDGFHGRVADAVFDACYSALEHYSASVEQSGCAEIATATQLRATRAAQAHTIQPRLHAVSAPMGSGKTTFSMAFMVAITRLAESYPSMRFGCVLLVDRIVKAEARFVELSKVLPDKVAVWTRDHDLLRPQGAWLANPSAQFLVDQLKEYPVIIVTHAFYKAERGDKARYVLRDCEEVARAITIVDEQMEDVPIYDVSLWEAERAWEKLKRQAQPEEEAYTRTFALMKFMRDKAQKTGKSLEKPSDDEAAWKVSEELQWFTTEDANSYAMTRLERIPDIAKVFGFAKSMAKGCAFITRFSSGAKGAHFVGYEPQFTIVPGMVLLDATADIDGVTSLCAWRSHVEVPQACYDNLSIVHVDCYTDENLSDYLDTKSNRVTYVDWMKTVIREHMRAGQRALIVCKKILIDRRDIPDWPAGDPRFRDRRKLTEDYGWDLDGRLLSVTYWGGNGIGANDWREAEIVFLFGEYFLPRRAHIGGVQGLQLATTSEGVIASMEESYSKSVEVEDLSEGHLLRWTKQMALRGRGRLFDGQGVCGKQKLVFTGDYERLLLYKDRMFPGAKLTTSREETPLSNWKTRRRQLLEILSSPNTVTTNEIASLMQVKAWRDVSKEVMAGDTRDLLKALGWTYVSKQGRGGSWFERIGAQGQGADEPGQTMAAE